MVDNLNKRELKNGRARRQDGHYLKVGKGAGKQRNDTMTGETRRVEWTSELMDGREESNHERMATRMAVEWQQQAWEMGD